MRIIKEKTTWYDLYPPTEEELDFLDKTFHLPKMVKEELQRPSSRQKIERHDDFIYVVTRFPIYHYVKQTCLPVEIGFLIKPQEIATIRYEKCEPVDAFFSEAENNATFRQKHFNQTAAELIHALLNEIFTYGTRELAHIDQKIEEISEAVFAGKEKEMIKEISVIKRDILDFRRITRPLAGPLKALAKEIPSLYQGLNTKNEQASLSKLVYFEGLLDEYFNLNELVENQKDTVESLETTNQTLLSAKIDEIMRIISIIAFGLAPFTIIGTLFQINTQFTPIIGRPYDWWIIFSLIALGCLLLYLYFRKRKWL